MAEFYTVKFGAVYLTDTGLVDGQPCRTDVTGLDGLQVAYAGNEAKSADNTPYMFMLNFEGQGIELKLAPAVMSAAVLASLKTLIEAAIAGNTTINVTLSGDTGDYDLECLPLFTSGGTKPINFSGKFFNGQIYDTSLNVVVQSVNSGP